MPGSIKAGLLFASGNVSLELCRPCRKCVACRSVRLNLQTLEVRKARGDLRKAGGVSALCCPIAAEAVTFLNRLARGLPFPGTYIRSSKAAISSGQPIMPRTSVCNASIHLRKTDEAISIVVLGCPPAQTLHGWTLELLHCTAGRVPSCAKADGVAACPEGCSSLPLQKCAAEMPSA